MTMDIMSEILEDLRFYAKMNLTPVKIELGPLAYAELFRQSMAHLKPGNPLCFTLFGIPVEQIQADNGWARGYRFGETNASIYTI
jgi:hypothetical protein